MNGTADGDPCHHHEALVATLMEPQEECPKKQQQRFKHVHNIKRKNEAKTNHLKKQVMVRNSVYFPSHHYPSTNIT
jgi:hypothetical protein